jgi:hypothetical protein
MSSLTRTVWVHINPERAREFLSRNKNNRPFKKDHGASLSLAFSRGEYRETHQGIAFDEDGNLLDGQHRLWAIAQQPDGFSVRMLVTSGLPRQQAWDAIDVFTARRTAADVLGIHTGLAAVCNLAVRLINGNGKGITPTLIAPVVEDFEADWLMLSSVSGVKVKILSSSAMRLAALCVMGIYPNEKHSIKDLYGAVLAGDFENMTKLAQAAYRAWAQGTWAKYTDMEVLARGFRMLTPRFDDPSKLQVRNSSVVLDEIRMHLEERFPHLRTP